MLFVRLYDFLRARRLLFWILLTLTVGLLSVGAARIEIEEDISRVFPDDPRVKDLRDVFQRSRFVERLVLMVAQADTTTGPIPDSLVVAAQQMESRLKDNLQPYIKQVSGKMGEDQLFLLYNIIHDNLPIFLDEK